ncbi:MAG TPA: hypothetical protein VIS48_04770 [Candidatus Kryptonia bacterium]
MKTNELSPPKPGLLLLWLGISLILVIGDYIAGPFIQFPITYLVPVALASWYNGRWAGITFAILFPLVRLYFNVEFWTVPWSVGEASVNMFIRVLVLSSFAVVVDRRSSQTRMLSKELRLLEGFLPVCSYCKKIRDEKEEWQPMEKYIMAHTTAMFTHGICPSCREEHFGEMLKRST